MIEKINNKNIQNYLVKITNNKYKIKLIIKTKNKILYKLHNYNEKILAKIYLSNFSKKLSLNEFKGHKFYANKKQFNIPKILFFKKNTKFNILLREYVTGKKNNINYFKLFNYYKFPKKNNLYKLDIKDYLNKFFFELNIDNVKIRKKLIKIYNKQYIYIAASHGDLIHYNLLSDKKSFFIDFEYFSENRSLYFDFFSWFTLPLITNIIRFKISGLINYIIPISLRIIFILTKDKIFIKKFSIFNMYFNIFLFEKFILMKKIYTEFKFENQNDKIMHLKVTNSLKKILKKKFKAF